MFDGAIKESNKGKNTDSIVISCVGGVIRSMSLDWEVIHI